jgi:hypothetical protein
MICLACTYVTIVGKPLMLLEQRGFGAKILSNGKQGCQIFLGATYQNGKKYIYQMTTKCTTGP